MNAIQSQIDTQFVRFDERGFGLAAVFIDFRQIEFSLCKNALKERIVNLEKIGYKCDTERAVLAEMERMSGCAASCAEDEDKIDYQEMIMEKETIWPKCFIDGVVPDDRPDVLLCADALSGWANCSAGAGIIPPLFGQVMQKIASRLGCLALPDALMERSQELLDDSRNAL